ncbi:MAG: hypothetical protein KC492_23250 [Myxococcales bacterium]|nr:hypothetical protein [Myxococcales bacterium]
MAPSHETRNELLRIADLLESEPARGEIALEALTSSSDRRLGFWVGLGLEFLRGEHETQCARYDGPLDGTRVGMVLFYTDVMAKIWAATDYAGSAPAEFVPGFRSGPRLGRYIPSEYEEESRALPSTRIWFGLRDDRLARDADEHTLSFAPIVTRVYTAGSNPLVPGAESTADESSRQVYGWWDRHYASVADHEPQFHLQNQIMKWSVITAALAERDVVRSLGQVPVDHTQRFDRYVNDTDGLRYQGPFRLLPDRPSARGTECMERLQSYGFDAFGGEHRYNITGGVSLVGRRSLGELRAAPWAARGASRAGRASLDVSPGRVLTQAPEAARFRRGAVQFAGGDVQMARVPGGLELHVGERQLHVAATRGPQGAVLSPAVRLPGADSARTSSILQRLRAGDDIVQATAVAGPNQRLISGSGSSRRSLADALAARPGQLGGSADDALEVALARVRRGDDIPGGSLSALPAPDPLPVTGGMRTQPASVRALGEAAALRGQFGEAATVVVGGRRARTVLRAEAVQPVPNRSRAFEQILSGDADVYVQESRALQSFDWDMDPRGSVARLVGDPRYVLERVPLAETAIFRPHMLADDASRYTLRQTAPYGAHLAPTRAGAARPVFRLRLCTDSTGDGRDDEAGSQCAAP